MTTLAPLFAALADDTRLKLVEHLMDNGEHSAGALTVLSGLSAPAVSRHLKVLRKAGVIDQRVAGTHRYYAANPDAMRQIADWTKDRRTFWTKSLDRLDAHLALNPEDPE
ncbi:MAG: metalloregulator ArsR/SmtB family transcription factor [Pseudomonadota bacterium]